MNELIISYADSKTKKIIKIIVGIYFTVFTLYFVVIQLLAKQYNTLFVFALIGFVLGIAIVLANTVMGSKPLVKIDNSAIVSNLPSQSGEIAWVDVTEMNIGMSYLLFIINGQKQRKIDFSDLKYKDLKEVKSKAAEICEFKNIPYKND